MSATADIYSAPDFRSFPRNALIAGGIAAVLCIVAILTNAPVFFRAYLMAYVFWFNIALGSLLILMIQHLTGGAWGVVIRRSLESAVRTLPLMTLLFIPILVGLLTNSLYEWSDTQHAKHDAVLKQKLAYLNPAFFIVRAVIYFAIWNALGYFLTTWSVRHDATADHRLLGKMARLSGPGLVIYAITITFASVDWLMSLEAHWYSTIYGAIVGIGQLLGAMGFMIAVIIILSRYAPMNNVIKPEHLHDLGKLLLAFVMLWAYLNFSQLIIIWSGNIPEETPWYLKRFHRGYQAVAIALVILHFALPFLLLLNRDLKRNSRTLFLVAVWVVAVRVIDLYWFINPATGHGPETTHAPTPPSATLSWVDLVALVAIGGLWLWMFVMNLKKQPLIPHNYPDLEEALNPHGH